MTELSVDDYGIDPRVSGLGRLDLPILFGNSNAVVLEMGSGKGRFLVESARLHPGRNYLGIEKSLHYYRVIVDRLHRRKCSNARVINHDAFLVLRDMIPDGALTEVHIYFPDPWPRPRERKRRMIREEVCREIERVLTPQGGGVYVTDHAEFFEKAVEALKEFFEVAVGGVPGQQPRTNYEAKYRLEGRPIYEVRFRKRGE